MYQINRLLTFIFRYKILHISFWIFYFFHNIHLRQQFHGGTFEKHIPITVFQLLSQMIAVYIIIYDFVPRFLENNKVIKFFALSASLLVIVTIVQVFSFRVFQHLVAGNDFETSGIWLITFVGITDMAIVAALFLTLTLLGSMYRKDQMNRRLEKEKLEAELNFLKSQTSPHFLFNALNSIYVLIDIDQKKARSTLLKFCDLLRYQLYECNSAVFLSRELEFLENYIELEKIRKKNLQVTYNRPEILPAFELMPFLVIPLVENAFKHVSHFQDDINFIRINITATDMILNADIVNSCNGTSSQDVSQGGIGLQNIGRRLQLLYPNRHSLLIEKKQKTFSAKLTIHADKDKLHHH